MVSQVTVFLENKPGRLAKVCRELANSGINMHSLYLADTTDFGVVRLLCDTPNAAVDALKAAGWRASLTQVLGVRLADEAGSLAKLLEFLDEAGINVEYGYCISTEGNVAVDILKVSSESAEQKLESAGFTLAKPEEIYTCD